MTKPLESFCTIKNSSQLLLKHLDSNIQNIQKRRFIANGNFTLKSIGKYIIGHISVECDEYFMRIKWSYVIFIGGEPVWDVKI